MIMFVKTFHLPCQTSGLSLKVLLLFKKSIDKPHRFSDLEHSVPDMRKTTSELF